MKTDNELRTEAVDHFKWRVASARQFNEDVDSVESDVKLGMAIVDAALLLAPGEFLSTQELFEPGNSDMDNLAQLFRVVPYLTGSIQLLDFVLWHEQLGEVDNSHCRELLKQKSLQVGDITLTEDTVFMRLKRKVCPSATPVA